MTASATFVFFVLAWFSPIACAQVTVYTDEDTFNAAAANLQFYEDTFEGLAPTGGAAEVPDSDATPIYYVAQDAYDGLDTPLLSVRDDDFGRYSLNGSADLVAFFDLEDAPTTVTMDFNSPQTAFNLNLGIVNQYGPDDPGSVYPHTDQVDIQLYTANPDAGTSGAEFTPDVPLGDVYHAGFPPTATSALFPPLLSPASPSSRTIPKTSTTATEISLKHGLQEAPWHGHHPGRGNQCEDQGQAQGQPGRHGQQGGQAHAAGRHGLHCRHARPGQGQDQTVSGG